MPRFPVNASITGIRFKQDPMSNKSRAVFGQATYSVAPGLRLTLGLRQTTDDKSRIGGNFAGPTAIKIATNNASVNFTNSSYKVGADYDLSKTALAYASIATGYKAGGFYDGVKTSTFDNTYKPERLLAFEAGIKGRFLDNKLRLNAAFYNYSYQDLQISYIAINPGSGTAGTIVSNAARAGARGIELEGRFAVSEAGAVNFAIGTNDAKYKSFVFPATAGVRAAAVDFAGKALDKAPQSTLTLGYTHDFNLAGGAGVTAFVGTRYSSAYVVSNFAGANPVQYTQDAFNKTDFNVTYNEPGNRWYAQIFGKNLQNRNVIMAYAPSSNPALDGVFLGEPRTVGMRAGLKF